MPFKQLMRCAKCSRVARTSVPAEPTEGLNVSLYACPEHGEFFETLRGEQLFLADGEEYGKGCERQ